MVVVDGEESSILPVLSGVPQGSVLSPLLFILFITDVTLQISPGSSLSLVADDMTLSHHLNCQGLLDPAL